MHHSRERKLTVATEFRSFVQRADRKLFDLFCNIDTDGDGRLDMKELQLAFRISGLTVSNARLTEFFNDMDLNNDGYVTFSEWRYVLPIFPSTRLYLISFVVGVDRLFDVRWRGGHVPSISQRGVTTV